MMHQAIALPLSRRAFLAAMCLAPAARAREWTQFLANGSGSLAGDPALPLKWSDEANISWRTQVPGYGQSSPVVAGDGAFVTSVEGPNKEALLLSVFALNTGRRVWTRRREGSQRIEDSDMVSRAAPTPAASGEKLFAFFETGNMFALDYGGTTLWERRLTEEFGEFGGRHGIGSSLRLCRSGVLVLVAHDGPSYLICLDPASGETVWKTDRPKGISWSTPAVVSHAGREIALISGGRTVEAYDTANGALLWTLGDFDGAFIASPTPMAGGAVIGSSTKGKSAGIRFGQSVETRPEVTWRAAEASSYFSSPLVHRDRVYMVNKAGVAFCLRADSGDELWHSRLEGQCWASSIGSGNRVYFFGVDGVTTVVEAGDDFEILAKNKLSVEGRLYGAAVGEGSLLMRYGRDLVRVAGS